ncbi:UNVERIFIED_CONTAM: hypothetical protein Sradi_4380500 [Sesamum radiatum]|uniref:Helitron helicase-like domain-containing protein n=1 Tax=Sesamum radiatum TaxID=300843 RepID=A0AAW2NRB1_SESRA
MTLSSGIKSEILHGIKGNTRLLNPYLLQLPIDCLPPNSTDLGSGNDDDTITLKCFRKFSTQIFCSWSRFFDGVGGICIQLDQPVNFVDNGFNPTTLAQLQQNNHRIPVSLLGGCAKEHKVCAKCSCRVDNIIGRDISEVEAKQKALEEGSTLLEPRDIFQVHIENLDMIEAQKLRWIRFHQNDIRAELYEGLQDCLNAGEHDAGNIGRRIILPSSFTGSPRDMYQRYQDAMAIVQKFGKPDIFLTMTCNPSWKEIKDQLLSGQTPQDRLDLLSRIFRAKYEELKEDIFHKGVLGNTVAHVHVIEFQNEGCHMYICWSYLTRMIS